MQLCRQGQVSRQNVEVFCVSQWMPGRRQTRLQAAGGFGKLPVSLVPEPVLHSHWDKEAGEIGVLERS